MALYLKKTFPGFLVSQNQNKSLSAFLLTGCDVCMYKMQTGLTGYSDSPLVTSFARFVVVCVGVGGGVAEE